MNQTVSRLRDAQNRHDADGVAACFSADYRSEQPLHPQRGFGGKDVVAANWSHMFAGIPDLQVELIGETTDDATSWSEWVWRGSHTDGTPFLMKGVTLMGLDPTGLFTWARLYMEPVDQGGEGIEESVRRLSGSTG
jgi:hypothetical protein